MIGQAEHITAARVAHHTTDKVVSRSDQWRAFPKLTAHLDGLCICLIARGWRGTGLSDRTAAIPSLEKRMDDVRAVVDTVGSKRAALLGLSEGGSMSVLFAATHPKRTAALILYGAMAWPTWAPDNPWGTRDQDHSTVLRLIEKHWGKGRSVEVYAPSLAGNDEYVRWTGRHERAAASPGAALALVQMNHEIDVRQVLATISIPTLVLHRTGDIPVPVGHGRYLAEHIPGAKYLELPGDDHMPWAGDVDSLCDEVQGFLTGARRGHEPDRILTTVLFTDIVEATKRAVEIGDRGWKELLRQHHFIVRQQLDRHRGRELDTAGDGFFASFDGPGSRSAVWSGHCRCGKEPANGDPCWRTHRRMRSDGRQAWRDCRT